MKDSIKAYDLKSRVKIYDAEMEIMHPNRTRMVEVPLEFMTFDINAPLQALDLGVGTGFFTDMFLRKFSNSHVIALDGAASMIDDAQARLGNRAASVEFVVADFRNLEAIFPKEKLFDVVFTSFALHHLTVKEKRKTLKTVIRHLKPGGLFFNADCIIAETAEVEERFQTLRVEGIVERVAGKDERYKNFATTRARLDTLEAEEKDNPIKLSQELVIMSEANFQHIDILWKDYREVVLFGTR